MPPHLTTTPITGQLGRTPAQKLDPPQLILIFSGGALDPRQGKLYHSHDNDSYLYFLPRCRMSQTMALTLDKPLAETDIQQSLDQLPKGCLAQIEAIDAHDTFGGNDAQVSQRLKELGFLPGARLRVIGFGLFGHDPIAVHINGTKFALRRAEARKIKTRLLTSA
jgi:ferrous iron transport protein A